MRWILLLLCLTSWSVSAQAQEQERKLVDRLLQPDMALGNAAQDKNFTSVGGTPVDKKFEAKAFSTGDEKISKSFWGSKKFSGKAFETKSFSRAAAAASAKANAESAYAKTRFATQESSLVRASSESDKVSKAKDYADSRPFLGQGTRQKILSQEDKPLTIDEVRELLNRK